MEDKVINIFFFLLLNEIIYSLIYSIQLEIFFCYR